jgi:crotonobetainyl-CoA:carnitine CoA-transferase CaiB-like acyl-CoA transferase
LTAPVQSGSVHSDRTRRLPGSGAGIFGTYNRNKRSISVNLKSDEGLEFATQLVRESDVLHENFGAGVLDRLGLGYDAMKEINPHVEIWLLSQAR